MDTTFWNTKLTIDQSNSDLKNELNNYTEINGKLKKIYRL